MATILAVAYGGGHINCILPVVAELIRRGHRVEVLALTTAAAVCEARGVPCWHIRDFPELQDDRSRAHGERLAGATAAHATIPREETVAYLGMSYRDLEDAYGIAGAAERFATQGRQAFLPVASMERVLERVRPDAVLATTAPRAEQAMVLAARRRGVPAVVIADLFAISEFDTVRDPAYGDRLCVLAPVVRERLIAGGRPADQVVVTGNPVFDRLGDPTLPERARAFRATRGWDGGRQIITWASQPEPADPALPRRIEAALVAAIAANPRWTVVLRPHPSDTAAMPEPGPQVVISTRADDLHTLLAASDVAVTMSSTVGLEACLAGRPLVTCDLGSNVWACPYSAMGFSLGVTDLALLPGALTAALAGHAPRPPLPPIGGATMGVADVVESCGIR